MKDERNGLPSASGMERIALCPGSWRAECAVTAPPAPSDAAKAGTRIAASVEQFFRIGSHGATQSTEEHRMAERMVEDTRKTYEAVRASLYDIGLNAPENIDSAENIVLVEERMWDDVVLPQFSGKPDICVVNEDGWGLIIDHKSGWNEVAEPQGNWQLRSLAVLLKTKFPNLTNIYVAIVQPAVGKPKVAMMDDVTLTAAAATVYDSIKAANNPDAPRIPSTNACRYCKARPTCNEARHILVKVSTNTGIPDDLSLALDMIGVAELVAEDVRNQAKAALEKDPASVPGWKLRPGSTRISVTDTASAFSKVKDVMGPLEFTRCTTVKFGELTEAFATVTKLKKKDAKVALMGRLEDVIEQKPTAASLVRSSSPVTTE